MYGAKPDYVLSGCRSEVRVSGFARLCIDKLLVLTDFYLSPGSAARLNQVCYMTDNKNKECVLYLKNRMGIVKMAALNGVAIIPTFTFNQVSRCTSDWCMLCLWAAGVCVKEAFARALPAGVREKSS